MKKTLNIIFQNSNALLIFITTIAVVLLINTAVESNRKASANLVKTVQLYTYIHENDIPENSQIIKTLEGFSGSYFGESGKAVTDLLEELKTQKSADLMNQDLLNLILHYQELIEDRLDVFNTLFYFLTVGIGIQFIFMISSARKYILTSYQLENSVEVLRLLSSEREKERLNISSHLHDTVLQNIGSILLTDEMKKCPKSAANLRDISNNLRNLTYSIAPIYLNTIGLSDTLNEIAEEFETKTGIQMSFTANGYDDSLLDNDSRLVFYRIAQESLNNVKKHAEAHHVSFKLVVSHPYLIMRIKDDGKGFNSLSFKDDEKSSAHLGMRLMHEQAKSINAVLKGESVQGAGTEITLKHRIKKESFNGQY